MLLIIFSYIADLVFGDPEWFPHPVREIGRLINFLDNRLRAKGNRRTERTKGIILALIVVGTSACSACLFIWVAKKLNPFLGTLAMVYVGYATLSAKDLYLKARAILKAIKAGSLPQAREHLSKIVGRDTKELSEEKIVGATVESIAESANDGIIAPLFYLILGGPALAIAYKSINTLDSMVGYRNEKYLHFGWFSARADDVANFIPARITGLLIPIASFILGKGFKRSLKTMLKDGNKHPSPNSGISEAAMAGALGIKLGGPSSYRGRTSVKPYIGEEKMALVPSLINEALTISLIASALMVCMGVILKWRI